MEKTISVQEMYDKYHNLWPSYSTGSPIRAAFCAIACELSSILDGRATIEECVAGLEIDRDESEEGVRYLYHPVIRDLRFMLDKQQVPEFDPDRTIRNRIHVAIDAYSKKLYGADFSDITLDVQCANSYNDLCELRDRCDASSMTVYHEIASIVDEALFDHKAVEHSERDEEEETLLFCEKCGGQFDSLLASPKGVLCEHCYYEDEDDEEDEQETIPEDVRHHLDKLSDARVERLVADALLRLHQISDWECETPETLKELQDNWTLVQALMPRYIEQFAAATPVVPVGCQCVLCKE